jgi:hypothetical protein
LAYGSLETVSLHLSFRHAVQPVAGSRPRAVRRARPVVGHVNEKGVCLDKKGYAGTGGGGVAHDVRQRLLNDPEDCLLDRDRNRVPVQLDVTIAASFTFESWTPAASAA